MDSEEFVVVVDAMSFAEADAAFEAWCQEHGTDRAALGDDVLIDTGRGEDHDWRRYRVRLAWLDRT